MNGAVINLLWWTLPVAFMLHTVICHVSPTVSSKDKWQRHQIQTWTVRLVKLWWCFCLNVVVVQALQFLSKAHRCQVQTGGWEKNPALFKEVLRKAVDMGEGTTNVQCPGQLMMIMRMMKMLLYLHPSFSGAWNNKQWLKGRFIFPVPLIMKGDEALRGSSGVTTLKSMRLIVALSWLVVDMVTL